MPNWSIFFGDLCREFILKTIRNINDKLRWLTYTVATIPSQPSPQVSHKFGSKPRCMPKSKSMRCPSKQLSSNRVSPHLLLQGFPQWRCAHQRHPKMCEFDVNLSHLSKIMETKIFIENTRTGCFGLVSNSPPKKKRRKNTSWSINILQSSPVQGWKDFFCERCRTRLKSLYQTYQPQVPHPGHDAKTEAFFGKCCMWMLKNHPF